MTEVIEGTAVEVDNVGVQAVPSQWFGDSPFFLVLELDERPDTGHIGIDLDFPGWATANAEHMRATGTWWLFSKATQSPVMSVVVEPGDQPYFTKHHVGNLMSGGELVAYGIGKKRANGEMVRVWLLPNGVVCGGDDVDVIAARMIG